MKKIIYFFICIIFLTIQTPSWSKPKPTQNKCEALASSEMINKSYMETESDWVGWEYNQTIPKVDLNADGKFESILIKARVSKDTDKNELLWDDGHAWAVIIREATGKDTIIFLQWIQFSGVYPQMLPSKKDKKKILRLNIPQADEYDDNKNVYKVSIEYDILYSHPNEFSVCKRTLKQTKK